MTCITNDTDSSPVKLTISRLALIAILLPSGILVGLWRNLKVGVRNNEHLARFAIVLRQSSHPCKLDRMRDRLNGCWISATFSLESALQAIYVCSADNHSFVRAKFCNLLGTFESLQNNEAF